MVPNPKQRSGSFGVLTVSFLVTAITDTEAKHLSLGLWRVTQSGKDPPENRRYVLKMKMFAMEEPTACVNLSEAVTSGVR